MIRFPPRRILVPFDRSTLSLKAWRQACVLADRFGASLETVYVEPSPRGMELMPPSGLTPARARELRADIRVALGGDAKITIVQGDPARSILRLARARRPELIVMGTHGRRGLSRLLLGSVTEAVMRASLAPVLAVRGAAKDIRAILAPVNFTSYSNQGFAYAASAAAALGARLTALYVDVDPVWSGNPRSRLARQIERLPPALRARCEPRVESAKDATQGILRASAKHDLIVLVAHKRGVLEDAVFGTSAERVLRGSKKPVLVVPPPPRPARRAAGLAAASWSS